MKLKVCGMRDHHNIEQLVKLNPDYMGFIFYPPSPRFVGVNYQMPFNLIPSQIKKTGVFVNENIEKVLDFAKKYQLEAVQLHGSESVELCRKLKINGLEIIKVFPVSEDFDFSLLSEYTDTVDYFLFDTKTKKYGGSGNRFNWDLLKETKIPKPFFLSGGIDISNASEILSLKKENFYAIDINSRFEMSPGLKDVEKIREFKEKINE